MPHWELPEPEILTSIRAFPDAQAELKVGAVEKTYGNINCAWYGTSVDEHRGSFAMIAANGVLDKADLVGERVQVTHDGRTVYAYVLGSADLPFEMNLTRRLFLSLALLSRESVKVDVAVIE